MAVLQKPAQCLGQAARLMKDKAKVLEGGGDGKDLTVHMPGASCWAMEDDKDCTVKKADLVRPRLCCVQREDLYIICQ